MYILKIFFVYCLSRLHHHRNLWQPNDRKLGSKLLLEIAVCNFLIIIINAFLNSVHLDGPETTEIVIFGQLNSSGESSNTIQLSVARLTQRPPGQQVQKRIPRPDDPTPRKPPAFFLQELKRTGSAGELKRVGLGSGVRLGAEDTRVFKIPEVPKQMKSKEKGREKGRDAEVSCVENKSGKWKQRSEEGTTISEVALEKANKNVSISYYFLARYINNLSVYQIIKRATIAYLSRTKDPTNPSRFMDKTHSDFKELYGYVYRGVGYALVRADAIYGVHFES